MHPPAHTNHTPKQHKGTANTPANTQPKTNWHTIEFSNTTHTPDIPANTRISRKRLVLPAVVFLSPLEPETLRRGAVGLADSHKATHITTSTQIARSSRIFYGCLDAKMFVYRRASCVHTPGDVEGENHGRNSHADPGLGDGESPPLRQWFRVCGVNQYLSWHPEDHHRY